MAFLDDFPLDQVITVERPTESKDANGRIKTTYTPLGTNTVFWWIASGGESFISERLREDAVGIVIAYPDADIKAEDRLTLTDGKQYRALYVEDIAMRGDALQIQVGLYG